MVHRHGQLHTEQLHLDDRQQLRRRRRLAAMDLLGAQQRGRLRPPGQQLHGTREREQGVLVPVRNPTGAARHSPRRGVGPVRLNRRAT